MLISVITALILARLLLGLFVDEESPVYSFCYMATEPVVSPVRNLLGRIPALADSPIDFSYVATSLILFIIQSALPYS